MLNTQEIRDKTRGIANRTNFVIATIIELCDEVDQLVTTERESRRLAVALLALHSGCRMTLSDDIFSDGVDELIHRQITGDGKIVFSVELSLTQEKRDE